MNEAPYAAITQVQKRDGSVVSFEVNKIQQSIYGAAISAGIRDSALAQTLTARVVELLQEKFVNEIPSVEDVQDAVEKVLVEDGQAKIAKEFILFRQERSEVRREKQRILEKEGIDEVDKVFDLNALRVLKARYLKKDSSGKLMESPAQLFARVAINAALPELLYDPEVYDKTRGQQPHPTVQFDPKAQGEGISIGKHRLNQYHMEALKRMYDRANAEGTMCVSWERILELLRASFFDKYETTVDAFYDLMVSKKFLPNTPAIANFGNILGMGSACFVFGIDDNIESIMETLKQTALVFKAGGGMGYNFSSLRPEGDFVKSTSGIASGPLSFMQLFDTMTDVIKQGGIRRGANMGILNSNHPDVEKFITSKKGNRALKNFNISVLIMPDFWDAYNKNKPYRLLNPRTKEVVREVNPKILFDMIVYQAWESAEPGVIFFDRVNEFNPFLKTIGPIVTTNPCGEVLLYPNESCNLGSINVWAFRKRSKDGEMEVDWDKLKETIFLATRFLDDVIDVNKFPVKAIEEMTLATRKIGLGVMGLADLLFELHLPYHGEKGRKFMEELMEFINYYSKVESIALAKSRGPMPYYDKSFYREGKLPFKGFYDKNSWRQDWSKLVEQLKEHGIRNGYTTIIAPTGSISMIAGCSSGIEPAYSLVFEKHVKVGDFYFINPVFQSATAQEGLAGDDLLRDVVNHGGSVQRISYIPRGLKQRFVTAMDMRPEDHIRALASFQKWVDSSISKTINFPSEASLDDMRNSYLLAYKLGCKDVTVFRDTSIPEQVLSTRQSKGEKVESSVGLDDAPPGPDGEARGRSESSHTKACPQCSMPLTYQEGCYACLDCGWSACS